MCETTHGPAKCAVIVIVVGFIVLSKSFMIVFHVLIDDDMQMKIAQQNDERIW